MPSSYTQVFMHFVWATWDRESSIELEWEEQIYAAIAEKCQELHCQLVAANGTSNHVHVLCRFSSTISIADFANHLKGSTSHLVNYKISPFRQFRWQGSYSAHCVEPDNVDRIRRYILNQKAHHATNNIHPEWECHR